MTTASKSPDAVRAGTFTITNHGVGGSLVGTPIINQFSEELKATFAAEQRSVGRADQTAPQACDGAVGVDGEGDRRPSQRVVARAVSQLDEAPALLRRLGRDAHPGQQLVRLEDAGEETDEELRRRYVPTAPRR